jgi:hypothetical protein
MGRQVPHMRFAIVLSLASCAIAAQTPLPELRVEPTEAGSVIFVKNVHTQPLTGFSLELVGYPGSSWRYREDLLAEPLPPKAERKFPVNNMLVGAAPDYVKVQAALYVDGSSAGTPEKVAQLRDNRKARLETARELIRRLEEAQSSSTSKDKLIAGLKQWARGHAFAALIDDTVTRLNEGSIDAALETLRKIVR